MTRDTLIEELKKLQGYADMATIQVAADELLLEYIGDSEVAAAFDSLFIIQDA